MTPAQPEISNARRLERLRTLLAQHNDASSFSGYSDFEDWAVRAHAAINGLDERLDLEFRQAMIGARLLHKDGSPLNNSIESAVRIAKQTIARLELMSEKATAPTKAPPAAVDPGKVTIAWVRDHVPVKDLWTLLALQFALLVGAFTAGLNFPRSQLTDPTAASQKQITMAATPGAATTLQSSQVKPETAAASSVHISSPLK